MEGSNIKHVSYLMLVLFFRNVFEDEARDVEIETACIRSSGLNQPVILRKMMHSLGFSSWLVWDTTAETIRITTPFQLCLGHILVPVHESTAGTNFLSLLSRDETGGYNLDTPLATRSQGRQHNSFEGAIGWRSQGLYEWIHPWVRSVH